MSNQAKERDRSRSGRRIRSGKKATGSYLVAMSVGALGVVYGDIGTSPLYALRESFLSAVGLEVNSESVLGILSLMVWSLILVVTIKYLFVVMRADNDGEGGVLALTALVLGGDLRKKTKTALVALGLFGTALLYGDGMITPAISVLAAVEGLEIAIPAVEQYVVLIAAVILVGLFMIQRRGTAAIGAVFGPIMILWFVVLGVLGVGQIVQSPEVLEALNPAIAAGFFIQHPRLAFLALGGIFLVVTGSEALYADMGHFGTRPIRLGWLTVVLPALALNYLGQGALVISNPDVIDNPFYRLAPSWAVLPLVGLATTATVIASQALISGAYSLTMQAVQLGYLPRQRIDHTSAREFGQIYVPGINWILMIATVGLVITFGSTSELAAAYGVAVTSTMVITTALIYVVMRQRWGWSRVAAGAISSLFLVVDLAFFGANILKIPDGGWFPLVIGLIVFTLMVTWKSGRIVLADRLRRAELPIERFIGSIVDHPQRRVPGTAVYMFPEVGATPPALLTNLQHNEVLHETVVLVSVNNVRRARVPQAERATVHPLGEGFYQIVLKYGFMQEPNVPVALTNITTPEFGFDPTDATYFLGRETVLPAGGPGLARWREHLFSGMHRNATSASQFFELPAGSVIEVGVHVEI
jgi:KUP system potassium uptake protein